MQLRLLEQEHSRDSVRVLTDRAERFGSAGETVKRRRAQGTHEVILARPAGYEGPGRVSSAPITKAEVLDARDRAPRLPALIIVTAGLVDAAMRNLRSRVRVPFPAVAQRRRIRGWIRPVMHVPADPFQPYQPGSRLRHVR